MLFQVADKDGDRVINIDEFVEFIQQGTKMIKVFKKGILNNKKV